MSRHSAWVSGDYPVFTDPTFDETVFLAHSRPDTLRLCVGDDHFGVASGLGNTHTNVIRFCHQVFGRRWWSIDLIFWHNYSRGERRSEWLWNSMGHWSGIPLDRDEAIPHERALSGGHLTDQLAEFCKDFIHAYDERWS